MDKKKRLNGLLGSFCTNPKAKFETQRDQENIILLVRSHPIVFLPYVTNALVMALLVVFLNFAPLPFLDPVKFLFIDLVTAIFILSYLWYSLLRWYFNVGIITNERVIDIDFYNVTYKEITQAKLGKIEDITTRSESFLESLFNYGDLFIQTAGEEKNIEFYHVPYPAEVVRIINDLLGR